MSNNDTAARPVDEKAAIAALVAWLYAHDDMRRPASPDAMIEAARWIDFILKRTFEDTDNDHQYASYAARLIVRDMVREVLELRIAQVRLNARLEETRGIKAPDGV